MSRSSPGRGGVQLELTDALGRACFCFVYRTKNISFLLFWFMAYKTRNIIFEAPFKWFLGYRTRNIIFEAPFKWFMGYRTRNVTFEARFLWFMAYGTRNATFEARLVWCMAYRTRNIFTFEARFLWFMAYRTGSDTFEAHLFRFTHIERVIFLLKRTCFALWLIERGILYFCAALVSL